MYKACVISVPEGWRCLSWAPLSGVLTQELSENFFGLSQLSSIQIKERCWNLAACCLFHCWSLSRFVAILPLTVKWNVFFYLHTWQEGTVGTTFIYGSFSHHCQKSSASFYSSTHRSDAPSKQKWDSRKEWDAEKPNQNNLFSVRFHTILGLCLKDSCFSSTFPLPPQPKSTKLPENLNISRGFW